MLKNGTNGDDVLNGTAGQDIINGLAGNDILDGGTGNDLLNGGLGNDKLYGGDGKDALTGGTGNDYLQGDDGADTYMFAKGDGQDTVYNYHTDSSTDTVKFTDRAATDLTAVFHNIRDIAGVDDLVFQYGNGDQVTIQSYFTDSPYQGLQFQFTDIIWTLADIALRHNGTIYNETLYGFNGLANSINGLGGDDALYGGDGKDTLTGGTGNDYLQGDDGADTYVFAKGDGQDTVYNGHTDSSTDTVKFTDRAATDLTAVFHNTSNDDLVFQYGNGDQVTIQSYFTDSPYQGLQFQFTDIIWTLADIALRHNGTIYNETLNSFYGLANSINGLGGDDALYGRDGKDTLTGGTGNDYLQGDDGTDTYMFAKGDGQDTIYNGHTDSSTDTVKFTDRAATDLTAVFHNTSNDDLVFQYGNGDQVTIESYFSDSPYQGLQFQFVDGLTPFIFGTDSNNTLTGTAGKDWIDGAAGNDKLNGGDGNDRLYGGDGKDTLTGGSGNDFLEGGAGADTYVLSQSGGQDEINNNHSDNSVDVVKFTDLASTGVISVFQNGNNLVIQYGISGQLTVDNYFSGANYRLNQFQFTDTTWSLADIALRHNGTINDDILYAYDGMLNTLNGLDGNDTLYSGNGNDTLNGGDGVDTASYVNATGVLTVNLALGKATGAAGIDRLISIENVIGGSYNDFLTGDAKANMLEGGAGNDKLDGGAGIDTVNYAHTTGAVTINLITGNATGADGTETVLNFENAIGGVGNDTFIGNTGDNLLDGGAGIDTVSYAFATGAVTVNLAMGKTTGADGTDILLNIEKVIGSAFDDTFITASAKRSFFGGTGVDTLSYQFDLRAVTVDLMLGKASDTNGIASLDGIENVTGGSSNDFLIGDTNNNALAGGGGNDTLNGKAGDDVLDGGNGRDAASYQSATGAVTVNLATGLTGGADGIDTLSNIENIIGSAFNDKFTGNDDSNNLNGGAGNDLLIGGLGNDLLDGRDGEDTVSYAKATGAVNVNLATGLATGADGSDYLLGIENLVGSGFADTLVGKDGTNILTGGTGADIFVFNSTVGTDKVTDFSSGVDKLYVSQTGIGIGDGDTLVENAVATTGPGGFSVNAELVIIQKNIAGAITTANAAAAIGNASSAYAIGATTLFAVDNGAYTDVFLFTSSANDSAVSIVELALIVEVVGVASTTPSDYGLVV